MMYVGRGTSGFGWVTVAVASAALGGGEATMAVLEVVMPRDEFMVPVTEPGYAGVSLSPRVLLGSESVPMDALPWDAWTLLVLVGTSSSSLSDRVRSTAFLFCLRRRFFGSLTSDESSDSSLVVLW